MQMHFVSSSARAPIMDSGLFCYCQAVKIYLAPASAKKGGLDLLLETAHLEGGNMNKNFVFGGMWRTISIRDFSTTLNC